MSPSPQDPRLANAVRSYGDAWRAIMKLVRSGHSWSGYERNCIFLNCAQLEGTSSHAPRFADVSAVSGLDLPDDGRGVAVTDWDHDGDLDLWLRNRSAPRLRFMRNLRNDGRDDPHSVSLRLVGTTCNRDAIGARAELVMKTADSSGRRLVRSVRAGDAFLSQSSTWLHFGIGKDDSVAYLIVDWPGGERERFDGIAVGERYTIEQGRGRAIRVKRRDPIALEPRPHTPRPPTGAARIVLPGRVSLPPLILVRDGTSDVLRYDDVADPTLIMFWTSSCANCRRELSGISKHRSEIERARLRVVAICLDGLEADNASTQAANQFLQEIDFPFQTAQTNQATVESIYEFQNALFSQYPGFVVPLSFIVDSEGRAISIYRGSYTHETFLRDRALVDLDDDALRTLATPLPGTWITKPATRSQFAEFVGSRLAAARPELAIRYLEEAIRVEKDPNRQNALQVQRQQLEQIVQQKKTK